MTPAWAGTPVLDARGLICPLPVLKARKVLLSMKAGEKLRVLATDASAPDDFRLFCADAGHRLDSVTTADGVADIRIVCGGAA